MYIGLHAEYPLFLSDFNEKRIFSLKVRENLKYQIYDKSPSGSRDFPWRQTNLRNLIATFRNFVIARINID